MNLRLNNLQNWLQTLFPDFQANQLKALPGDAGFRRYYRLSRNNDRYIVVDVPPGPESAMRFVEIAQTLHLAQIAAPQILNQHHDEFLLLEDFGDDLLYEVLGAHNVDTLYGSSIQTLAKIQTIQGLDPAYPPLESFDHSWMMKECLNFEDWFLNQFLQLSLSASTQKMLHHFFEQLVNQATEQPQVFIHRDYHSKNLFCLPDNKIGVIDFQDAMTGPITYDLVPLLKDGYVDWPKEKVKSWAYDYYLLIPSILKTPTYQNFEDFYRDFEWMGCQRHIKAIFIFVRKYLRDSHPGYLTFVPRTLNYIREFCHHHKETAAFQDFLETVVMPKYQQVSTNLTVCS